MEYKPDPAAIAARAMRGPIADRLDLIAADFRERLVDYTRALDALVARLAAARAGHSAPDIGQVFPDFILPDASGQVWHLASALGDGPVVLAFHRGYWCDFCHLNMAALAEISPQITATGARIVAISPEPAEYSAKLVRDAGADFRMLCDIGLGVSTLLGLTFVVDADLQRELRALEVDVNLSNGGTGWLLPITATFVLDRQGRVVARHLDPDPRRRMDGNAILQAASACQAAARS